MVRIGDIIIPNSLNEYNTYIDKNIDEIKEYIKKNEGIKSKKTYYINSRKVTQKEYEKHRNKDFSDDFFKDSDKETDKDFFGDTFYDVDTFFGADKKLFYDNRRFLFKIISTKPEGEVLVDYKTRIQYMCKYSSEHFKFIVKPSLKESDEKMLKQFIVHQSGLNQIFSKIDVIFADGYQDQKGVNPKLKGKEMFVQVDYSESDTLIEDYKYKDKESELKSKYQDIIRNKIENIKGKKYKVKVLLKCDYCHDYFDQEHLKPFEPFVGYPSNRPRGMKKDEGHPCFMLKFTQNQSKIG